MDKSRQSILFSDLYEQYMNDDLVSIWSPTPIPDQANETTTQTSLKFDIELKFNNRSIMVECHCSNIPDLTDVFYNLVNDALSSTYTFENFCEEYGYTNTSINHRYIYDNRKVTGLVLLNLLGEELYNTFLNCEMDM